MIWLAKEPNNMSFSPAGRLRQRDYEGKAQKDDGLVLFLRYAFCLYPFISNFKEIDLQHILLSVRMPRLYNAVVIVPIEPISWVFSLTTSIRSPRAVEYFGLLHDFQE
jgi:hypothetical protein